MSNEDRRVTRKSKVPAPLEPQVRFPDFQGADAWTTKSLKEVCEINPSNAGIPQRFIYIDLESVEAGELKTGTVLNREDAPSRAQRPLKAGDVIFQIVRPYQRNNLHFSAEMEFPCVASTGYAQLRANESEGFLFQAVHADDFVNRVIAKCTGSSYPAINSSDLADIRIAIPGKSEQKKIADCLSSLDELVKTETQKLRTLETYKMGLMQQLFPCEGEAAPRLRFSEFAKAGAWTKIPAGKIFSNRAERGRSGLPIYSVTMNDGMVPRDSLARRVDDIAEAGINKAVRAGDIAYNMMRMWQGALGVAPEDCMVSPAYVVLEPHEVNPFFFLHLLKLPKSLQVLTAHSRGLTEDRLRLYFDDFAKIVLQCPSRREQDRIADFLMSMDKLITAQVEKVSVLNTHKNGLMQRLFPVIGEVTE
jgi:type I restriction enzyme S subunit